MLPIPTSVRVVLGIIAALTGLAAGMLGNALWPAVVYKISRRGRRPKSRPPRVWAAFFVCAAVSTLTGALAALPPASSAADVVTTLEYRGASFELGGHVSDWSLPHADLMHYAGMEWAKAQIQYADDASSLIDSAHANDFKIQLTALGTPEMVTELGFEGDFADWVAELAANGANAIEVWNEPNIEREWQAGYISPEAYTRLLCAAYDAIKDANSSTLVISAAPAPTGYYHSCDSDGCDDLAWVDALYSQGAANCMDYLGAHHVCGASAPSERIGWAGDPYSTHYVWYFQAQTESYYGAFGESRQLFYTEMGYASQEGVPELPEPFWWARGITDVQQASWLAEAVQLSMDSDMVRFIMIWNIDFERQFLDPQDAYAIVRAGGSCPACNALHNLLGAR